MARDGMETELFGPSLKMKKVDEDAIGFADDVGLVGQSQVHLGMAVARC